MAERNNNSPSEIESLLRIPRNFGDGSDLILGTLERAEAMEEGAAVDADGDGDDEEDVDNDMHDSLRTLMGRLRCLFGALTCPIPTFALVVALALLHFVGVAFVPILYDFIRALVVDRQLVLPTAPDCGGRPIFAYAGLTLLVAMYAPYHMRRRRHDKIVHSLALLYLYFGLVIMQSCNRTPDVENGNEDNMDASISVCATHCPALIRALHIYVGAMELFTVSLFIPLLFIPCIYVWFLRQADQERTLVEFHQRYTERGNHRNNSNTAFTVSHVLEQGLQTVQLVERGEGVVVVGCGRSTTSSGTPTTTRECCICMTDLVETNNKAVVQTKECGHLFHRQCLASWIGGRWEGGRRARRTTCPLCRSELLPPSSTSYGTMR